MNRFNMIIVPKKTNDTKKPAPRSMLDDPFVNLSLTTHGTSYGIDHIGLQAEDREELGDIRHRLEKADTPIFDQADVNCCYAQSSKAWVRDPDGVAWETFFTEGESIEYGDGSVATAAEAAAHCAVTSTALSGSTHEKEAAPGKHSCCN